MDKITQMPVKVRLQMNRGWGSVEEVVCEGTIYHHNDTVEALHTQLEAMAEVLLACKQFGVVDATNSVDFEAILDSILEQYQQFKEMNNG